MVTAPLPEVSIVVPTRDRWQVLERRALRSALLQEGVAVEVIIVDDGSRSDPPPGLSSLGDPRVRLLRLHRTAGVAAARNEGIAAARGDWVAFLDDDDVWAPTKLRLQLEAADGADVIYAGALGVDEHAEALYGLPYPEPADLRRLLLASPVIPAGASNVVVRTDLVRRLGGFDENLAQLADWDLWIRLVHNGRVAGSREVLVGQVQHDGNMLLTSSTDPGAELTLLDAKHRELREAAGVAVNRRALRHWIAWGHLRRRQRLRAARVFLSSAIESGAPGDALLAVGFVIRALLPLRGGRRALQRLRGLRDPGPVPEPPWLEYHR